MVKPNLFIVGAPKCGTTSVHNYLEKHPEVFMSQTKEPRHFCTDLWVEYLHMHGLRGFRHMFPHTSREDYLSLFRRARRCEHIGESSPDYLVSEMAASNIADFNPHAKIIILLRNPIEALQSTIDFRKMNRVESQEHTTRELVEKESQRIRGHDLPKRLCPFLPPRYTRTQLLYSKRYQYTSQVRRYLKLFPKNVHIILFEEMVANPLKVRDDLCKFLHIRPIGTIPKSNTTRVSKQGMGCISLLIEYYLGFVPGKNLIPMRFRKLFGKLLHHFSTRPKKRRKPDNTWARRLFYDDVVELNKLLHQKGLINRNLLELWNMKKPDTEHEVSEVQ